MFKKWFKVKKSVLVYLKLDPADEQIKIYKDPNCFCFLGCISQYLSRGFGWFHELIPGESVKVEIKVKGRK